MFTALFYLCRERGLRVSVHEWAALLEGCALGLHQNSLTGFYRLCRATLVKSESDLDRFDQVFLEFFQGVPFRGELPPELLDWLDHPSEDLQRTLEELQRKKLPAEAVADILELLEQRLREQGEEHNGGTYWVGTQGRSPFGNDGWRPGTLRVGGESRHHAAALVAGERRYRDFRRDNTLDTRQFQMAFRLLRQLSAQADTAARELDVEGTVHDTCRQAGVLRIRCRRARKNAIKVLLLMDSGGSMDAYAALCSRLFQAAHRSNQFKELHTYYFHNCIYGTLFQGPELLAEHSVPTDWVLQNFDAGYRVILVGDAAMNPYELREPYYNWNTGAYETSGLASLTALRDRYPHLIWLNPKPLPAQRNYWTQTHLFLSELLPMYDLSVQGLETGMRRLMAKK